MGRPEVASATTDAPAATSAIVARLVWLAAAPVAFVIVLAAWLLAPGPVTDPARITENPHFFDGIVLAPEPIDRFRYGLGLLAPVVVGALVVWAVHGVWVRRALAAPAALAAVVGIQVATVALTAWFLVEQDPAVPYFGVVDVALAAVVTAAVVAGWRERDRLHRLAGNVPGSAAARAAVAYGISALIAVSYVLTTVVTDGGIGRSLGDVRFHLPFTMGDFTAFANGRTPLVDFVPQYTNVLPYAVGPVVGLGDGRISAFTASMAALTAAALAAVFVVLRSVTRTAAGAAVLFVPFVALTFLKGSSVGPDYASIGLYYAVMPMRYVGPWLALAACLPYLRRPSRPTLLLATGAAGLVAANNLDWGIPALGAVGAALWCGDAATRERPWRSAGRLAAALAAGAVVGLVVLVLLTLLRAGTLPDLGLALEFPRLFAVNGYFLIPAPTVGPYLALYLTFVAAVAFAVGHTLVGGVRDRRARIGDAALAFGGIFGLGAGAYYMGRSHPGTLFALFSVWGFVVVLLAYRAVRGAWAARDRVAPVWVVPSLAAVFLFGLAAATVREVPAPWRQVDRLTTGGAATYDVDALVPFVQAHTRPGEDVAILAEQSHRLARASGVHDVTPFNSVYSVISFAQLDLLVEQIDAAGVTTVLALDPLPFAEVGDALVEAGFRLDTTDPDTGLAVWQRPPP